MSAISAKLPPNWKCKRNKTGMLYYFNEATKVSQWNFPKCDQQQKKETKVDERDAKQATNSPADKSEASSSSLSSQPDVSSSSGTSGITTTATSTTQNAVAVAVAGSEIHKIFKDQFREKLSRLVVKLLQPYMSSSCRVGRIDNVADFKHLARKFTHSILEKEISRVGSSEMLDLDNRIKVCVLNNNRKKNLIT